VPGLVTGRVPGLGTVVEFDEVRGLGRIERRSGELVEFHCTAIADGSRRIDAGTPVAFVLVAAIGGSYEAQSITPV